MGKGEKRTESEFLELLSIKNILFKEGGFTLEVFRYESYGYALLKDEFGYHKIRHSALLKNINPSILSSTDRLAYFNNKYFSKYPDKKGTLEFTNFDENNISYIIGKTEYGVFRVRIQNLMGGIQVNPESYINKSEYYLKVFEDFDNNCIYSGVEAVGGRTYANFYCEEHGDIRHRVDLHMLVKNCPKCARYKSRMTTSDICERSLHFRSVIEIERDLFETVCYYDHTTYNTRNNVVANKGCKVCRAIKNRLWFEREDDFEKSHYYNSFLYLMKFESDDEVFYKVGVTKNIENRRTKLDLGARYNITIVDSAEFSVFKAFTLENELINLFNYYKHLPAYRFGGYTECFSENIFDKYTNMVNFYNERQEQSDKYMCEDFSIDYEEQFNR